MRQPQSFQGLDLETEVLSKRGWIKADSFSSSDEVLTKNFDSGFYAWAKPHSVNLGSYTGDVVEYANRSLSLVSTPFYPWCTYYKTRRVGISSGRVRVAREVRPVDFSRTGGEVLSRVGSLPGNDYRDEVFLSSARMALLGWVLTDGWFHGARGTAVSLSQSLRAKPKNVAHIDHLFNVAEVPITRRWIMERSQCVVWQFKGEFPGALRLRFPKRILTPEFVSRLDGSAALILKDAMVAGDGLHSSNNQLFFFCRCKERADIFQMLAQLAGISTTARFNDKQVGTVCHSPKLLKPITIKRGHWLVSLLRRDTAQLLSRHRKEYAVDKSPFWNMVVDNGSVVVRRSGYTYVAGAYSV